MSEKKIIDMDDLMLDNVSIDSLISLPNVPDAANDWKHKGGNTPAPAVNSVDDLDISAVDLSGLDPVREDYAPAGDTANRFVYADESEPESAPAQGRDSDVDDILSKYRGGFEVGKTAPAASPYAGGPINIPDPVPQSAPSAAPTAETRNVQSDNMGYSSSAGLDFDLPPLRRVSSISDSYSAPTEPDSGYQAASSELPPLRSVSVPSADDMGLPPLKPVSVSSADDMGLPPMKPVSVPKADDMGLPPMKPVSVQSADDMGLPPLKPVSVPKADDNGLPPMKHVSVPKADDNGLPPMKPVSVPKADDNGLPPLKPVSVPKADDMGLPPLKPAHKEEKKSAKELPDDIPSETEDDSGFIYEEPHKGTNDEKLPADMSDVAAPKLDDMMEGFERKASFERPENKIAGMDDPFSNMSAARRKKLEQGFDAPVVMKKVDPSTYWEIEQNERRDRAEKGHKFILILPVIFAVTGVLAFIGNICVSGNMMFGGIACAAAVIAALSLGKGTSGAVRVVFVIFALAAVVLNIYSIDISALMNEIKGGSDSVATAVIAVVTAVLQAVSFLAVSVIIFINKNIGEYFHSLKQDK